MGFGPFPQNYQSITEEKTNFFMSTTLDEQAKKLNKNKVFFERQA